MYPQGFDGLKSGSGLPMSLESYSSYPMAHSSYSSPRQPQPRNFTGPQITNANMRSPTSTRWSSDTYGRGTPASAPAKKFYDSKYSPRGTGTSHFGASILRTADECDDYSDGASSVTDDGIYVKESEIMILRGDYGFGFVAPRTPKTPKFPPMAAEPRAPTPRRIADKYPQWKSQMLPSATLLEKFPSNRPCCAGHDTYCVHCTPELDLLTLRRFVGDIIMSSPATKHAETYTNLIGGPPYSESKNSTIGPAPKLATKSTTSTTYGDSNSFSYSGSLIPRKTAKSITSSTNGEYGSEFDEYDYTSGVKNKSPSAAVTPWYTRPITGPILQASPGLRTVEYATPRTSETPYGIAQARNGHPIYCILDTGAAVTTISPSILLKAFPGIKIISHRSVIGGVGGATYNTRGRIVLNMVWTGVDGRQVMTKGEA